MEDLGPEVPRPGKRQNLDLIWQTGTETLAGTPWSCQDQIQKTYLGVRPPARGARPPVRAAEIGGGGHVGGHVPRRAPSKRKWGLV
ncbi:hypothetical protein I79_008455 [Cricetulus griseus]|uniref:Uncharacterized protein n=1 Tax=Cricetulus griseus TaxID=10029 RepID=G3HD79_CRIGR|nr:hypothetical protein I79_008455 [Cricetulus griseus]